MSDSKGSALTAAQWLRMETRDASIDEQRGLLLRHDEWEWAPAADRHSLAALALHDQPFGFTWEDVDRIQELADEDDVPHTRGGDELGAWLDGFKARIAALLPPRE